ncbi:hypothetical protein ACKWTF_007402 [Chironomus riparius]
MNKRTLLLILFMLCTHLCTCLPVGNITEAYNLHQNLSLHDINELGKDQRVKALLDVQTTIDEVEKLLIADPALPRLTKGEIRDLFEKVTKEELKKSISNGDLEKQEFMKNLILALPYHADEFLKLDKLAASKATTMHPIVEPVIPDELKLLLKSHGLLNDDKNIGLDPLPVLPSNDYPMSSLFSKGQKNDNKLKSIPKVNAESYTSFKQLEVNNKNVSAEIEKFLNTFGLLNETNQSIPKSKKEKSPAPVPQSAYLTSEFSDVLNNMGIQKPKFEALTAGKNVGPDPVKEFKKSGSPKNGVKRQESNPTKVSFSNGKDEPLLESSLEATDDDDSSPKTTQQPITTTKASTTSTTPEPASTTEQEKKNNLEDEIEPIDEPEQLPSPRRSGFYMIFDWNTFLEVGEDPEKIIVRFDPKVGDPSRFLPVTIP